MPAAQDYSRIFTNEQMIVKLQTDGLTTADTLIQPRPSGNCMNWVLGHLVINMINILDVLQEGPTVDSQPYERYQRESDPITAGGPEVLPLERLLADYQAVSDRLIARLGAMEPADFEREVTLNERVMTIGWRVFFLHFHHAYHIGQLELLRQLAGRTEKII